MSRDDPDTILSKKLTKILRHQAVNMGFAIGTDGYIKVQDLLDHRDFRGYSMQDVKRIVESNDKKRFELNEEKGALLIRAAQGHSMKFVNDEELLKAITDPKEIPVCIHGTYNKFIDSILEKGLCRM